MPGQVIQSIENNFTKGLVTEFTGLNFPENAATECDNTEFTIIGDTIRREGIDFEENYLLSNFAAGSGRCFNTYRWNNVAGDGSTQIIVVQFGLKLYFYLLSSATATTPLSMHKLASTVDLSLFAAPAIVSVDHGLECTFADGNGYLFVFNQQLEPLFCSYNAGTITAATIDVKIRDFAGMLDHLNVTERPTTLSTEHNYNLINQGWTQGTTWWGTSVSSLTVGTGNKTFTTQAGMSVTLGDVSQIVTTADIVGASVGSLVMTGTVTAYNGGTGVMTINVSTAYAPALGSTGTSWTIYPTNKAYINSWFTAEGNYPSNADVWWRFRNVSTNAFDPTVQATVSLASGDAPKGHFILSAFNQNRSLISGIAGLTSTSVVNRPDNGCWFQGRVWYTGVTGSQQPTGDASFYTWSENIYFSQICVGNSTNFGACYQLNDPTSEGLNGLLPTDGGVIQIQGSGRVFKLFPIQNGLLVFAANGVWFITGNQGIGFAANDYTITKLSIIESISRTSYVNVMGFPYFWNEEGIYQVETAQNGQMAINPITVSTILSYYSSIPLESKKYARGAYNPIDYTIQWVYKSTNSLGIVADRYKFDKILNYNVFNKAFFPYTVDTTSASINGINYCQGPGGSDSPSPSFKYFCSRVVGGNTFTTFAEEIDITYVDWKSSSEPVNYDSFFITGYKVHGKGQNKLQTPYVFVYSRQIQPYFAYYIQGLWDYATSGNSGDFSTREFAELFEYNRSVRYKRHRIRGRGMALQLKFSSVDGQPFDFIGWSVYETVNQGV